MKTLRVRITDKEWEALQQFRFHGMITTILRKSVKEFLRAGIVKKAILAGVGEKAKKE